MSPSHTRFSSRVGANACCTRSVTIGWGPRCTDGASTTTSASWQHFVLSTEVEGMLEALAYRELAAQRAVAAYGDGDAVRR